MESLLKLDGQSFLAEYWQRKPLFIADGLTPFTPPADGNELAGLAMEDGVDAQIISGAGADWSVLTSPFEEQEFSRSGPWTLMVHGVDEYWDDAASLLRIAPWLPTWRLDNIMMSYATDGGSAGPHFDQYDVFIVQGEGQRRWQIGEFCDADSPLLPLEGMKLLAEFEPQEEYVLECGDVLYVPPRCAHFGVSLGESTSFSVGFRAPRMSDLLARFADNVLESLDGDQLLQDAGRSAARRAGEITDHDVQRAREQILSLLTGGTTQWFGESLTGHALGTEERPRLASVEEQCSVGLAPGARVVWQERDDGLLVFNAGSAHLFRPELMPVLELLCGGGRVPVAMFMEAHGGPRLLRWLMDEGTIDSYGE